MLHLKLIRLLNLKLKRIVTFIITLQYLIVTGEKHEHSKKIK